MRLRARLQKLEHNKAIDRGCPACRARRGLTAMVDVTPMPEGMVADAADAPRPCEWCGVVPESVIEIVEIVVESPATG
jgi:hypothetical protein